MGQGETYSYHVPDMFLVWLLLIIAIPIDSVFENKILRTSLDSIPINNK